MAFPATIYTDQSQCHPVDGAKFIDVLPTGLKVAASPSASTTCTGSPAPTWAPVENETTLILGRPMGRSFPAAGSATFTSMSHPPVRAHAQHQRVHFLTESGTNSTPSGSAKDSLVAVLPPLIDKYFNADSILANGRSTLTFIIAQPESQRSVASGGLHRYLPHQSPGPGQHGDLGQAQCDHFQLIADHPLCGHPSGEHKYSSGAASSGSPGARSPRGGTCTVTVDVTVLSAARRAATTPLLLSPPL